MLRRRPGVIAMLDVVDLKLLEGVDAGLRWSALLSSATCDPDEAGMRIMRLIQQGHLEGRPGESDEQPAQSKRALGRASEASVHTAITLPPPSASRSAHTPTRASDAPSALRSRAEHTSTAAPTATRRAPPSTPYPTTPYPSTPYPTTPTGKTVPPSALAAREALLRELATRRSGASYPPVGQSKPSEPARSVASTPAPGYYSHRPDEALRSGVSSTPPAASGAPLESGRNLITSAPPGRYSVQQPQEPLSGTSSSNPPGMAGTAIDSPLASLIQELAGGPDLQRWCAAQLRQALHQDLSGQVQQALGTLQGVMAQLSDPRIRVERDRLQAKSLKATSGVYRARALSAERAFKHQEAAESWRKVLEACPDDAEAAVHAAMCSMESGDLRQAGVLARRAVELDPKSLKAHRLLLRFFRKTGMELNASREREILRSLSKG